MKNLISSNSTERERDKLEKQREALIKSCETFEKKMRKLAGEYKAAELKLGFVEGQLKVINAKISSFTPTFPMDTNIQCEGMYDVLQYL